MNPVFYDAIASLFRPSAWWGRLGVSGLEHVPASGPLLVVPNHDSQWDPVLVGLAIRPRRRLRFIAHADLWRIPGLGPILDGLGQIPIRRGGGDAAALDRTVESLRDGHAVCVFPEGRLSFGEPLRARTGVGLLAGWCPEARVVLSAVEGCTDYVRFPRRPRVTVRFFPPSSGQLQPGEHPTEFAARLLAEVRALVPPIAAGRRGIIGGSPRIRRVLARAAARAENSRPVPQIDVERPTQD